MIRPLRLSQLLRMLFLGKSQHGLVQLFRYIFVGGFSAIVDTGTLYGATTVLHINYLISAALAFILGTIVNYFLSVLWVFQSSGKLSKEITLFTLVGLGGLGLNELILWILHGHLGIHVLVAKFISVSIVVIWSYSLRRLLFLRLHQKVDVVDIM